MDEKELLKLKEEIDGAKTEISVLEGTKNQLMKDLKGNWACTSFEEAERKYKEGRKEIGQIDEKIDKGVKELNEKYEL